MPRARDRHDLMCQQAAKALCVHVFVFLCFVYKWRNQFVQRNQIHNLIQSLCIKTATTWQNILRSFPAKNKWKKKTITFVPCTLGVLTFAHFSLLTFIFRQHALEFTFNHLMLLYIQLTFISSTAIKTARKPEPATFERIHKRILKH